MHKQLAKLAEMTSTNYISCMDEINQIALKFDLKEYTTYSRIWEYPWLWFNLKPFQERQLTVLDLAAKKAHSLGF